MVHYHEQGLNPSTASLRDKINNHHITFRDSKTIINSKDKYIFP